MSDQDWTQAQWDAFNNRKLYHRPHQLQMIEERRMTMYMNDYQIAAAETAQYDDPMYPVASLMVESAELADLFIKPWLRGDMGDPKRAEVVSEAGDVLWNLANLLRDMDITLDEVAQYNVKKIKDRQARGVISGSGGNR
jgi:NTP pyrophosphatase (non-canonical NTP hydrolase)